MPLKDSGREPPLPFASCADFDGINLIFPQSAQARQESGPDFLKRMAGTLNPHPVRYWVAVGKNIVQQTLRITIHKKVVARNLPAPPAIQDFLDQAAIDAIFESDPSSELDRQLFLYVTNLQRLVSLTEQAHQLSAAGPNGDSDVSYIIGTRKPLKGPERDEGTLVIDDESLQVEIRAARELVNVTRRVLDQMVYDDFRKRLAGMEDGVPAHLRGDFRHFAQEILKSGKAVEFCVPPVLSVTAEGEPHITIYPWLLRILQRAGAVQMQIDMTPIRDNLVRPSDKPFYLRIAFGFERFSRFHLMELQRQGLLLRARAQLGTA